MAWVAFPEEGGLKGSIAKKLSDAEIDAIKGLDDWAPGCAVLVVVDKKLENAQSRTGLLRIELGKQLDLAEKKVFKFCWIVDFPMYEWNEEEERVVFSHNPFSMPQGEMDALQNKDPLDILAWQYDIVCNGVELFSGAIRNHRPDIMVKAFEWRGIPVKMSKSNLAVCSEPSNMAHLRMVVWHQVSTDRHASWPMSPTFERSFLSQ